MKITEIFHSVQGEGPNVGLPCVFVRLFGCNLACDWCDTKYAWRPQHARFETISARQAARRIFALAPVHANAPLNIVFTGGEPALFQPQIRELRQLLLAGGREYSFELETNGAFAIEDDFWRTINISPKLSNSGNAPYEIKANTFPDRTWWKFVVESVDDMAEILKLIEKHQAPRQRVLLMPQAQTREQLAARSPEIIELCKQYGFRFGSRLHVAIYSDKDGV